MAIEYRAMRDRMFRPSHNASPGGQSPLLLSACITRQGVVAPQALHIAASPIWHD